MIKLLLVSLVLTLVSSRRQDRKVDLPEENRGNIEYVVGVVRNFWQGFEQQVFKKDQAKLDTRCFDQGSQEEMAQIYWAFYTMQPLDFYDAVIAVVNLFYDTVVDCNYEGAITVFINHCKNRPEMCEGSKIKENLEENVFTFIEICTDMADVFENQEITELQEMETIVLQIGKDLAIFIEAVLGIPTHSW